MTSCVASRRVICLSTLLCVVAVFVHSGRWLRDFGQTTSHRPPDVLCVSCAATNSTSSTTTSNNTVENIDHWNGARSTMVMVAHRFTSLHQSLLNDAEEAFLVVEGRGPMTSLCPSLAPHVKGPPRKIAVVDTLSNFVDSQKPPRSFLILTYTNAPLVPLADLESILLSNVGDKTTKRNVWAGRKKNSYLPYLAMVNHYLYARSQRKVLAGNQDVLLTQFFGTPMALLGTRENRIQNSTSKARWRRPHFIKLLLIEAMLPLATWVLWIDQDAFFVNWKLSLSNQLQYALSWREVVPEETPTDSASNVSMIFSITSLSHTLNNGVGFYCGDAVTRTILERVWTIPVNSIGDAFDNSAFNHLLDHVLEPQFASTVRRVPGFVMNAYPAEIVDNQWKRIVATEALLRHQVSAKPGVRKRGYAYHDSFYREGDWIVHGPGVRLKKSVVLQYICFAFRSHHLETETLSDTMLMFESRRRQAAMHCDEQGLEKELSVGLRAWLKVCGNWTTAGRFAPPGYPLKKLDY